jgi:hypothetical protein
MARKTQEQDAYELAQKLSDDELAMAAVSVDMRLDGTWPKHRPAPTGRERQRLERRAKGIHRAWNERFGQED